MTSDNALGLAAGLQVLRIIEDLRPVLWELVHLLPSRSPNPAVSWSHSPGTPAPTNPAPDTLAPRAWNRIVALRDLVTLDEQQLTWARFELDLFGDQNVVDLAAVLSKHILDIDLRVHQLSSRADAYGDLFGVLCHATALRQTLQLPQIEPFVPPDD